MKGNKSFLKMGLFLEFIHDVYISNMSFMF